MPRPAGAAAFLVAGLALALVPALRPPAFVESFLYLVFHWIALATSWTILSGFSGYFSFGHGAFFGAGMYAAATLAVSFGMPFAWTLPAAGGVAALLGLGVGAVVFRVRRLRGELFALLTLAVTFVLATIVLNTRIDGGPGVFLAAVAVPKIFASAASTIYVLGLAVALAAVGAAWIVQGARLGRGLFAIADDEDVAEVLGVPTYRFKLIALGLSCFLAGVAGGIHAIFVTYVTVAETFSITVPLYVVLMCVLGGARHWLGPAVGATFVTLLTYAFVGGEWAVVGRAVVGLTLIAVILFLPQGLFGLVGRRRPGRAPAAVPAGEPAPAASRLLSQPAPDGSAPPGRGPASRPLVRCEGVRKAFHGVQALAGVDFEIREGEILGLVGPNGSGKSTLVNVISGYYRPDAGRILFNGTDLARQPGHRIARLGVARTYQIPRPFARLTVQDNVTLAGMFGGGRLDRGRAEREARQWLDFVGLADRAAALPTELNLHQRKFLELARGLASGPRLVLLDEVLSGLTPSEIGEALALVREIRRRGATILFIEHIMRAVVDLTDRVVVLNHGQLIAEGRPREVIRQPEVIAAYLGKAYA
ncbi:MAG: ATP-binding cassette domain-containing protein [Candidatus Rokubacteria bacterium]|nr:ATP-binding cassette domain-containing protein [Candidatus Rokubacteria bacterium]